MKTIRWTLIALPLLLLAPVVGAGEMEIPVVSLGMGGHNRRVAKDLEPWLEKYPGKWVWNWLEGSLIANESVTDDDLAALAELRLGERDFPTLDLRQAKSLTGAGLARWGNRINFQRLWLDGENTDAVLSHLGNLPNLRDLRIDGAGITDAGLAHLGKLVNLQYLTLSEGNAVTDAGLARLGNMSGLSTLNIHTPNATAAGYVFLADLPALRSFSSSTIGDDGMDALLSVTMLRYVGLDGNGKVTNAGLAKLATLPNLSTLRLHCPGITEKGLAALETFPALIHIYLRGEGVTDRELAAVGRLRKLRNLGLEYIQNITAEGIASLAGLPELRDLLLHESQDVAEACLPGLGKLTQLETLRFNGCGRLSEAGMEELRKALPQCRIQ